MKRKSPEEKLFRTMQAIPPVDLQNRLNRVQDRVIALAMLYMTEGNQKKLLSKLALKKAERVRDEYSYQKRIRMSFAQYSQAVDQFCAVLLSSGRQKDLKSYIRPVSRHRK
ncbi:MAG: FliG C-terminal domain-containing protein [Spirochaetia bacterium]